MSVGTSQHRSLSVKDRFKLLFQIYVDPCSLIFHQFTCKWGRKQAVLIPFTACELCMAMLIYVKKKIDLYNLNNMV